jgi:hypothetical protein
MVKSEFIFLGHLSNKQSYGLWVFFFFFDLNCMMYIPLSFTIDRVFFVFLLAIWSLFKMFSTSNVVLLLVGLRFLSNLLPKYISSDSEVLLACSKKIKHTSLVKSYFIKLISVPFYYNTMDTFIFLAQLSLARQIYPPSRIPLARVIYLALQN